MILPYLKQETFPLWLVERPKDTVLVTILINESDNKFHYVNLTKSHICKCGFDTIDDALEDMKKQVDEEIANNANQVDFEDVVEPHSEQTTPDFMKEQDGAYEDYITEWCD